MNPCRRVFRLGQTRDVNVYYLQHKNAYIETGFMDAIHVKKRCEERIALDMPTETDGDDGGGSKIMCESDLLTLRNKFFTSTE